MATTGSKACIVGIGNTEYRKWGGFADRSELSLVCEAVRTAAADAGVPIAAIDGFSSYSNDANEPQLLQASLGTGELRFAGGQWGGGGGGGCGAVALAALAVESGMANYVAIVRGVCQGQRGRYGQFRGGRTHSNFMSPFGLFAPPQMMAMVVQRHMHLHGTRPEHLAGIVINARQNASRNPDALFHDKPVPSIDQCLEARMIADPLRLFDCCLECDGACAVIVTTLERARDLKKKPAQILAAAQGSAPGWGMGPIGSHNQPADLYTTANARTMARELYGRAGVRPDDIDVAQLYDHFSGMVLIALEDYGFCGIGESGPFVAEGNIAWPNGRTPINTSGGHLAESYIHGMTHIVEGVRQIRGESHSQIADASLCLVCSSPAVAPTSALILGG